MDRSIKRALIIGASGGIGREISKVLRARGDGVTGLSRSADGLDITCEASIERILGQQQGSFDLIFVASGALVINGQQPEKSIKALDPATLIDQFKVNAIGPALVLKHSLRMLPRDRPCVFAALSARVGSIGDNRIGGWHSYRSAKAALNQLIHGAAIELARTHPKSSCVCLHPGTVETGFSEKYAQFHKRVPAPEAAHNLMHVLDGMTPETTGKFFDYAGKEIAW
jgi:NAD(P)-dependent dehydrogenase (short-subunit alcohol dehydrogenase family)